MIRFSLQVRVHDLMDPDYLSFRYRIIYNQTDINSMIKKGLNIDDLENFPFNKKFYNLPCSSNRKRIIL